MKVKKTSFKATASAVQFVTVLVHEMDIPRTSFHRKMIDYFIENDLEVHPFLRIRQTKDPYYIKREETEQIYLDETRELQLQEAAEKNNCSISAVLFQAMLAYSIAIAPEVLGKKEMEQLFPGMK